MARKKPLRKNKPHPPWGATKRQGERNAEIRDLHNRIAELEKIIARVTDENVELRHMANPPMLALTLITGMPIGAAVEAGIQHPLSQVCSWLAEVKGDRKRVNTLREVADRRDQAMATIAWNEQVANGK